MSLAEEEFIEENERVSLSAEAQAARRREYRRNHKADYRFAKGTPVRRGTPFCIAPEVGPMLKQLAAQAAIEAGEELRPGVINGINILGARAAVVMGKTEAAVVRRLNAIIGNRQLYVSAPFVEACLMALDVEHEYRDTYGEWPSCRADALERVSIEAEIAGKKVSPTKLLDKANRLYEKGIRKALKHAPEVKA